MKTWLITGVSRGLGLSLARAALARGDKVIGTVRDKAPELAGLRVLELDVTDPSSITDTAKKVAEHGKIDVLVNNAGFGLLGAIEDASDADIARVYDVNVFGPMRLIRALLPHMRAARSGHIINVTSIAGRAPGVGSGIYASAKAAIEGYSAALAQELEPLGLHVTAVAPGQFRTDFLNEHSIRHSKPSSNAYETTVGAILAKLVALDGKQQGNPDKAAEALLKLVDAPKPPVHLLLGNDALERASKKNAAVAAEMDAWSAITTSTGY